MKKKITIGGAIVGFLCGCGVMVLAYCKAPGSRGLYELLFQAVIVGVLVLAGAFVGALVGAVCAQRKK